MKARLYVLPLLLILSSCGLLGEPTPTSFSERLAAGYSTVTSVRQTALTLLEAQKIGSKDAENIREQANTGRAGLDIARDLRSTNPQAAQSRLDATLVTVNALKAYLESQQ